MFHNDQDEVEFYAPAFKDGLGSMQKSAIEQFLNNERSNVDYEILHTVPKKPKLRSIRYSDGGRLLFVKRNHHGKKKWLILEDLPTHKHKTSHFMRRHVLANFLNIHVDPNADQTSSSTENEIAPQKDKQKAPRKTFRYQPVFSYGQEILALTAEQAAALHTKPPLIIDGAAGTGKTCIAWALLETLAAEDVGPVIYLAQSEQLVKRMREDWNERPIKLPTDRHVQFFTYEEYAKANCPELLDKKLVDKTEFKSWLELQWDDHGYLKNWSQRAAKDSEEAKFLAFIKEKDNDEKVYEEFRILSGHSEKEYLQELGERESLFDKAQRPFIIKLFNQYKKHLDEHQMADLAFYKLNLPTKSDTRLIVDEALDLSHGQIDELIQATPNIYLCNGILQNLKDRISNRTYQEKRVKAKNGHVTLLPLKKVLRQGPNLTSFANLIAWILCKLRGGISHKHMPYNMQAAKEVVEKDSVHVIEDLSAELTSIKTTYLKSDIAYIVPAEQKEALLEHTSLVYTADEIKGLQNPCVIDLDGMQDQIFSRACKKLASMDIDWEHLDLEHLDKNGNRAKRDEEDDSFDIEFHKLYTAVTRATGELYIVQKRSRDNALLFDLLKRGAKQSQQKTDHKPESAEARAKAEAEGMFKRALELRRNGDIERAMKIREELTDAYRIEFDLLGQETNSAEIAGETSQAVAVSSSPEQTRKATSTLTSSPSIRPSQSSSPKKPTPPAAKKPTSTASAKTEPEKTPVKATSNTPLPKIPNDKQFKSKNVYEFLETKGAAEALFALEKNKKPAIVNFLYSDWKCKVFIEALQKFFSKQPGQKRIPISFFCTVVQVDMVIDHMPAIFTGSFLGVAVLMQSYSLVSVILLNQPPEFAAEIAAEMFKSQLFKLGNNTLSATCFDMMSEFAESCGILNSLQDKFNIARFLTSGNLYKSRRSANTATDGLEYSNFVHLTEQSSGAQFLLSAYQKNPELLEKLPDDLLFAALHANAGSSSTSPFANLLSFPEGRDLLFYMFEKRPQIFESMQYNDLLVTPSSSSAEEGFTEMTLRRIFGLDLPLRKFCGQLILNSKHSLLLHPFMHAHLLRAIGENQELLANFAPHELLEKIEVDVMGNDTTAIYRFSGTPAGRQIILKLIQSFPLIQEAMKKKEFLEETYGDPKLRHVLAVSGCIYGNLYYSKTGRKILEYLGMPISAPSVKAGTVMEPVVDIDKLAEKIKFNKDCCTVNPQKIANLTVNGMLQYAACKEDAYSIHDIEFTLTHLPTSEFLQYILENHQNAAELLLLLADLILPSGKSCLTVICKHCPGVITHAMHIKPLTFVAADTVQFMADLIFATSRQEAPLNFYWLAQSPAMQGGLAVILEQYPNYLQCVTQAKIIEQAKEVDNNPLETLRACLGNSEAGKRLAQIIGLDKKAALLLPGATTTSAQTQAARAGLLFPPPTESPEPEKMPAKLEGHLGLQ